MDYRATYLSRWDAERAAEKPVYRLPCPQLSDYVLGYAGTHRDYHAPTVRSVAPHGSLTLSIDFEPAERWDVSSASVQPVRTMSSPVTGIRSGRLAFEQRGTHYGISVGLTPMGAYALFGLPLRELTNTYVSLSDLLGKRADRLTERLAEAADWDSRFALLDHQLTAWTRGGPELAPPVLEAWRRITRSAGQIRISSLVHELGWTLPHLQAQFHKQIGLSPKTVARIARLQRALEMLTRTRPPGLSEVALACGYGDQPHFNRDYRALTGCTPTHLLTVTRLHGWKWRGAGPLYAGPVPEYSPKRFAG